MPYPPAHSHGQTTPETALAEQTNDVTGGTGNANTIPGTTNDADGVGSAMSPYGSSYSTEAQEVFDRIANGSSPTALTDTEKVAIAAFVDSQVANSNWAALLSFQCYMVDAQGNSLVDWIDGTTGSPTEATVNGTTTTDWTYGNGYNFVTTSGYIDTGSGPQGLLGGGTQNDQTFEFGAFVRDYTSQTGNRDMFGAQGAANAAHYLRKSSTPELQVFNFTLGVTTATSTNLAKNKTYMVERPSAGGQNILYVDGVAESMTSTPAAQEPTTAPNFHVNGRNNNGANTAPSFAWECLAFWAGAGLPSQSGLHSALVTLRNALGISAAS